MMSVQTAKGAQGWPVRGSGMYANGGIYKVSSRLHEPEQKPITQEVPENPRQVLAWLLDTYDFEAETVKRIRSASL